MYCRAVPLGSLSPETVGGLGTGMDWPGSQSQFYKKLTFKVTTLGHWGGLRFAFVLLILVMVFVVQFIIEAGCVCRSAKLFVCPPMS